VTWQPRALVQTDLVPFHHGADDANSDDGQSPLGLTLRRARLGADFASDAWRARVVISVESTSALGSEPQRDPVAVGAFGPPASSSMNVPDVGLAETRVTGAHVTEAFVAWSPGKAFGLWAGSLRVPLGLARGVDEGDLRLPERARVTTRMTPDFRPGAKIAGDWGLLQYALGAFTLAPLGASATNEGNGPLTVLRLSAEPVGPVGLAAHLRRSDDPWYGWWRFSVGLSLFHARLPGTNEFGAGLDGQFQRGRFLTTGEMLWSHRGTHDRVGLVVEPGVFVWRDRVELVARAEWFNDDVGPQSPLDIWGTGLGATLYSAGRAARIQGAYFLRAPLSGDTRPSGWATVRLAFVL